MNKSEQIDLAKSFAALGHESRILVFFLLLARASSGYRFGELKELSEIPASTLSHHLNEMERGGLIERLPNGRTTLFRPCLTHLTKILTTMMSQCCVNEGEQST